MALYAWLALLSAIIREATALIVATTPVTASIDSTPRTTSLFIINPVQPSLIPPVYASIMNVIPSLSQTHYWIMCEVAEQDSAPCHYIHGASVTVDPTSMALDIHRETYLGRLRRPTDGEPEAPTEDPWRLVTESTLITVGGTATCDIADSTWASCAGQLTSSRRSSTRWGSSVWGSGSDVAIESIRTVFTDVAAHSIPITVTAGLEKVPTATGTASPTTSYSAGAELTVPGMGLAVIPGAVALASWFL
ncbi:hypothetical protein MFIFM68171_07573 [Madurella fahalii]|uniref:Uncharacterized protein n=1 Tax=Madurella fahalii TaxID=1157608 RepID=A0ABQ0GHW9_9PEZI